MAHSCEESMRSKPIWRKQISKEPILKGAALGGPTYQARCSRQETWTSRHLTMRHWSRQFCRPAASPRAAAPKYRPGSLITGTRKRRYVRSTKRHDDSRSAKETCFDAEDVASDVIVYILSRPDEISRVRELGKDALSRYVHALTGKIGLSRQRDRQHLLAFPRFGEKEPDQADEKYQSLDDVDPLESYSTLGDADLYPSDLPLEELDLGGDWLESDLLKNLKRWLSERGCLKNAHRSICIEAAQRQK